MKIAKSGTTLPTSLGKADADTRKAFVLFMEEGFHWLRYCENHWKSEQVWTNHYGPWLTSWKAGEVVVKTEANTDDEDDTEDEDHEDDQTRAPKRPQKGGETSKSKRPRVESPPPPPRPAPTKVTTARIRVRLYSY